MCNDSYNKDNWIIIIGMSSNLTKLLRLNTQKGPKSIGPYSTASIYKGIMYISGQIGLDPTTG